MLTADVRFEGWTAEDWQRFVHLWKPRASPEREPTRPRGALLVIHDGTRIRKMLHTGKGRIDPRHVPEGAPSRTRLADDAEVGGDGVPSTLRQAVPAAGLDHPTPDAARRLPGAWPVPLAELAEAHHASWALAAHVGALDEVMERFGARARRNDDLTVQALSLVVIVRDMLGEGKVDSWPRRLRGVPPPSEGMVRRTLDALCDDGHAITLGMFKDDALWTSFVARRRGAGFDVIAGPDELRPAMGLLSGDFRRDYRHLVRAVEERYAPLSFGCFADVDTFRELSVDARPGAWGKAVALRDIVLSPIPTAIGLALGFDGARYALEAMKGVTGRFDPFSFLDPVFRRARRRLGSAAGNKDVGHVLGFDPLAALRALLRR